MKKRLFITVLCLFLSMGLAVLGQPVEKHGQLHVEGTNIIDRHGQKVALKGISLGWHNWWPQYYNPSVVEYLSRSWHISVIRAAMGVEPSGGYLDNPEKAETLIQTVIDAAIANGIYVIIDWHSHDIYTSHAELFFSRMAQQYAGHPNIIYEIFNEPEHRTWQEIKAYSIKIIEAIRRYDRENLIIAGTPDWSQAVDAAADDPVTGYDNIVYSLHFYANTHKAAIRKKTKYAIEKGLPVFVTECSPANANGAGELNQKEFAGWMKLLKQHNISYVLWGLYDKEESTAMLKPGASQDGHWPVNQLTEMGYFSRRIIDDNTGVSIVLMITGVLFIAVMFRKYYGRHKS